MSNLYTSAKTMTTVDRKNSNFKTSKISTKSYKKSTTNIDLRKQCLESYLNRVRTSTTNINNTTVNKNTNYNCLNQLYALLWKSTIIRLANKFSTFFEIFASIFMVWIVISFSRNIDFLKKNDKTPTYNESAGPIYYDEHVDYSLYRNDNIKTNYTICYAPNTTESEYLFSDKLRNENQTFEFQYENDIFKYFDKNPSFSIGIYYDNLNKNQINNGNIKYTIYEASEGIHGSQTLFPMKNSQEPVLYIETEYELYTGIQYYINNQYIQAICNSKNISLNCDKLMKSHINVYRMPYPKHVIFRQTLISFINNFGIFLILAYVLFIPFIVRRITSEKETKTKELLKMIGMSDLIYWLSHFINYFVITLFQSLIICFLMYFLKDSMLAHTSKLLTLLVLILFGAQLILFSMTITTFFNSSILATIFTIVIWITGAIMTSKYLTPNIVVSITNDSLNSMRRLVSLTPFGSMIFFFYQVGEYELTKRTLSLANINNNSILFNNFNILQTIEFMILSIPIYCFLIFYFDNAWPFQELPKPLLFFLNINYWFTDNSKKKTFNERSDSFDTTSVIKGTQSNVNDNNTNNSQIPIIYLKNVNKTFTYYCSSSPFVAVKNLNLRIYPKEITVLLGHNGAGKTTTMSMITGLISPTYGKIFVNGFDIQTQTSLARQSMSLCPQDNIIFNELTVTQHLRLFAMLKGMQFNIINEEIDNILEILALTDKKHEMAISLSGGMKRRLSLAIALIGNSGILILDEPSSGLDPDSRRNIWDLLISIRKTKTILLTTHFMEEADILGDRIIILSMGVLKCDGSPLFLKRKLGAGYKLKISKQPGFSSSRFMSILQKYIPTTTLLSEIETEVVYSLESPMRKPELSQKLIEMFENIEGNRLNLNVDSYGLSYATLEDVFLSINTDTKIPSETFENDKIQLSKSTELRSGLQLLNKQILAILIKRFHYSRRFYSMIGFQMVIPILIILFCIVTQKGMQHSISIMMNGIKYEINKLYGDNTMSFYYGDNDIQARYLSIITREKGKLIFNSNKNYSTRDISNMILDSVHNNLELYKNKYLFGIGVHNDSYDVWINLEQNHSPVLAFNTLYEAIICTILEDSTCKYIDLARKVAVTKNNDTGLTEDNVFYLASWLLSCLIFIPLAFPFVVSAYIIFIVEENICKSKLIQLMSTLSPGVYWLSNFIYDMCVHSITIGSMVMIIYIFDDQNIIYNKNVDGTLTIFTLLALLSGYGMIPLNYILSHRFKSSSSSYVVMLLLNLIAGFILNLIATVLFMLQLYLPLSSIMSLYSPIIFFARLFPLFSFLFGYQKSYYFSFLIDQCQRLDEVKLKEICSDNGRNILRACCPKPICDPCVSDVKLFSFNDNGSLKEMLYMFLFGTLCMLALLYYEIFSNRITQWINNFLKKNLKTNCLSFMEDDDVQNERKRIEEEFDQKRLQDILSVYHLGKCYGGFTAVDDLTFGIHPGECFGMLGVNGAGKTTTFSILSGDILPTRGDAFLCNGSISLSENLKSFQSKLGYCPQFDALLALLTGEETLNFHARIIGIPSINMKRDVKNIIRMVGMEEHANRLVEGYSGGTKRKLSIGIALLGNPKILLLDEPSSGVDPSSKRKIWQTLGYVKHNFNCSILLSSHSMDECEALCSRLAIMVNGRFRCLGSTRHLRSKYGQGYTVMITLKSKFLEKESYIIEVQDQIQKALPSAVMKDYHNGLMHYHITDPKEKWSNLFRQMVILNEKFQFDDYHVSDTTLEQIFLTFARNQNQNQLTKLPKK